MHDAVPTWAPYVGDDDRIYVGGPVSPEGAICLARCPSAGPRGRRPVRRGRHGRRPTSSFRPLTTASAWSTCTATRPMRPAASPPCGSSPATPAGAAGSSRARSSWAAGTSLDAEDDDVFTDVARDAVARRAPPPAGAAASRGPLPARPVRQLTPGPGSGRAIQTFRLPRLPPWSPTAPRSDADIAALVEDSLHGIGMAAAGANVIMQLSKLPVGHGVAKSPVTSGRIDDAPAEADTDHAGLPRHRPHRYRRRARRRSATTSTACTATCTPGPATRWRSTRSTRSCSCGWRPASTRGSRTSSGCSTPISTTTPPSASTGTARASAPRCRSASEQWPADRQAFAEYWAAEVAHIRDGRPHARLPARHRPGVVPADTAGRSWWGRSCSSRRWGSCPSRSGPSSACRGTAAASGRSRRMMRTWASVDQHLPRVVRQFPFNVYGWDTRRRIRNGTPVV